MRITIHGSYGTGNRGDNVILLQLLRFLDRETPGASVTVLCQNIDRLKLFLGSDLPECSLNITPMNASLRSNFFKVLIACLICDLFILGGGGVLWGRAPGNLSYWLKRPQITMFARRHVVFYVPGIFNVTGARALRLLRRVASRVDFLSTRDTEGLDQLTLAGIDEGEVILGADPAFLLHTPEGKRIESLLDALGLSNRRLVGLSALDWRGRYSAGIFAKYVDMLLEDEGVTLLFFAMQMGGKLRDAAGDDLSVATDLLRTLDRDKAQRVLIIGENYSIDETIALFGACEYIIGMRLHSLIFSAIAGTPYGAVSNDDKVIAFMRMVGREHLLLGMSDASEISSINQLVDALVNERMGTPARKPVEHILIGAGHLSVRAQVMHRKLGECLKQWFPPRRSSPATGWRRN